MAGGKTKDNLLLRAYFMRHQESQQNAEGRGESDTPLTDEGRRNARELAKVFNFPGFGPIDIVIAGTLSRHDQTLNEMLDNSGYQGEVLRDSRLNAIFGSSPLLQQPAEATVAQYDLDRLKAGEDGLHHAEDSLGKFRFDPAALGILPFDPLYCRAYEDKRLRQLVFPGEDTLPSFDSVDTRVAGIQNELICKSAESSGRPVNVLVVSSCSPNGFNLERAAYGTIGENMSVSYSADGDVSIARYGVEGRPIFPQEHDQLMVLGYTEQDRSEGRERLRVLEGNRKIDKYLDSLGS